MSNQQKQDFRDVYERLRALTTAPGETYWRKGKVYRKRYTTKGR